MLSPARPSSPELQLVQALQQAAGAIGHGRGATETTLVGLGADLRLGHELRGSAASAGSSGAGRTSPSPRAPLTRTAPPPRPPRPNKGRRGRSRPARGWGDPVPEPVFKSPTGLLARRWLQLFLPAPTIPSKDKNRAACDVGKKVPLWNRRQLIQSLLARPVRLPGRLLRGQESLDNTVLQIRRSPVHSYCLTFLMRGLLFYTQLTEILCE